MFRRLWSRKSNSCLLLIFGSCVFIHFYSIKSADKRQAMQPFKDEDEILRKSLLENNETTKIQENEHNSTIEDNGLGLLHVHKYSRPNELRVNISSERLVSYGYQRNSTGFLTLGIPTVKRKSGCEYLLRTLDATIKETSETDKKRVVIVIFLADTDQQYNKVLIRVLTQYFKEYFESGFMRILQPPPDYYPDLSNLKRNFGDELSRVQWRAKQVLDYAFMFHYCANISYYYMQLEDDVLPKPGYIKTIESFIKKVSKEHWVELDFSGLGYIGKLYKKENMIKLAQFMMMFFDEQPVDWLNSYFRMTLAQKKPIVCKPPLFSHIGLESSYRKNTKRKVNSKALSQQHFLNSDNCLSEAESPKIDKDVMVFSSMRAYKAKYGPESSFNSSGDYFWAVDPRENDTLSVIFKEKQNIESILVETGTAQKPKDILHEGTLWVSQGTDGTHTVDCINPVEVCKFSKGKCSYEGNTLKDIRCIVITVKKSQKDWIIFTQLRVH